VAGFNTGLTILAAVVAVLGVLCLWWRKSMGREIALMAATETSKAGDVARLAPGTLVELKGTLRCEKPLVSEFAQQPCVYFRSEIEREEVYYDRDSDGKQRRNTRKISLHSNIQHTACAIEDDSGRVAVDPEGADIEAVQVVRGYGYPPSSKTGGETAGVIGRTLDAIAEQNIRHWEMALAVDVPAYLIGEVRPGGTIGKPAKGSPNKTFVISHKSGEERVKDIGTSMTMVFWLAIALFAAAVATLVWAYSKGPA
jgi:hypothetical protein